MTPKLTDHERWRRELFREIAGCTEDLGDMLSLIERMILLRRADGPNPF